MTTDLESSSASLEWRLILVLLLPQSPSDHARPPKYNLLWAEDINKPNNCQ